MGQDEAISSETSHILTSSETFTGWLREYAQRQIIGSIRKGMKAVGGAMDTCNSIKGGDTKSDKKNPPTTPGHHTLRPSGKW